MLVQLIVADFVNKEQKTAEYMKINPNGKVSSALVSAMPDNDDYAFCQIPTLVDHNNNNFAIWESNAILQYLVSEYDKEHKISVADDDKEGKYRTEQWLFFQASGQGPYFG